MNIQFGRKIDLLHGRGVHHGKVQVVMKNDDGMCGGNIVQFLLCWKSFFLK